MEFLSGDRSNTDERNDKGLFVSGSEKKNGHSSAPVLTREFMNDDRTEQLEHIDQMIQYFKTTVSQIPDKQTNYKGVQRNRNLSREEEPENHEELPEKAQEELVDEDRNIPISEKLRLIEQYEKMEEEIKKKRLDLERNLTENGKENKIKASRSDKLIGSPMTNSEPLKTLLNPTSGSPKRNNYVEQQEVYQTDIDSGKKEAYNSGSGKKPFTYGILNNIVQKANTPQKKIFPGSLKLTDDDFNKRSPSSMVMSSARRALREEGGSPGAGFYSESRLNTPKSRIMNLYQTSVERQERLKAKVLEKEYEKNNLSNSIKTTRKSQQIFLKKLESKIYEFIADLEKNKGLLNFEGVFNLLHKIGVFHARTEATKLYEIDFLCDFWKLLLLDPEAEGYFRPKKMSIISVQEDGTAPEGMKVIPEGENEEDDNESGEMFVNSKLVFEVLILLLETKISIREATAVIRERVSLDFFDNNADDMSQQEIIDYLKEAWENLKVEKIVSDFRKLFEDKRYFKESIYKGSPTGSRGQAQKWNSGGKENPNGLFKPMINQKSREIDMNLNENYILKVINNGLVQNYNEGNTNQIGTKYSFRETVAPQPSIHMLQTASILDKSRHELLYEHSRYLQGKKEAELRLKSQKELSKCTFAPAINSGAVLNQRWDRDDRLENEEGADLEGRIEEDGAPAYEKLYELHKRKINEKKEIAEKLSKMKQNQEISECTFHPQLYVTKMDKKREDQPVKGVTQVIERLTKGREKQQEQKKKMEELGKIKNTAMGVKSTVVKPFSFSKSNSTVNIQQNGSNTSAIHQNEESVFVDVAYAPGKKARIVIKKNERPEKKVRSFAKIYSLNETIQENLIETLYSILGMVK